MLFRFMVRWTFLCHCQDACLLAARTDTICSAFGSEGRQSSIRTCGQVSARVAHSFCAIRRFHCCRALCIWWCCLGMFGVAWGCLVPFNIVRRRVALSGAVWCYLVLSGAVWCCLALSGVVWSFLVLSGAVWCCLVLSGAVSCCLVLSAAV